MWAEFRTSAGNLAECPHVLTALQDSDPTVEAHAWKILREAQKWPSDDSIPIAAGLADAEPRVKLAVALALVRHPSHAQVSTLATALRESGRDDAELRYALRMAIRSAMSRVGAFDELARQAPPDDLLRTVAGIAIAIPSTEAAEFLWKILLQHRDLLRDETWRHVVRHGNPATARQAIKLARTKSDAAVLKQAQIWSVLAGAWRARGKAKLPEELLTWALAMIDELLHTDPPATYAARRDSAAELIRLGSDRRLVAKSMQALRAGGVEFQAADRKLLLMLCGARNEPWLRALTPLLYEPQASTVLRRQVRLAFYADSKGRDDIDLELLLAALRQSPATVQLSLARAAASHIVTARVLADELLQHRLPDLLLQDRQIQQQFLALLPIETIQPLKERLESLQSTVDQKLVERQRRLLMQLSQQPGNAENGGKLFVQHCAICHQLSNQGALIGPQLDGIGQRGAARLIEDIVDPNRNVDPQFRTILLRMEDGRVMTGLMRHKTETQWTLADQQGKEFVVDPEMIEASRATSTSLMPTGLAETIGDEKLRDIIAFLLQQTAKRNVGHDGGRRE